MSDGQTQTNEQILADGLMKCNTCGVPWAEHLGIQGTCSKLKEAEKAVADLVLITRRMERMTSLGNRSELLVHAERIGRSVGIKRPSILRG